MCNNKIQMYNIVAQYVIKVKTVPPGKRQSKACGVCFPYIFQGSLWQKGVFPFEHLSCVKSRLFVRARSGVNAHE